MSTSSGYVLAGDDLDKLEFWWWYSLAVRSHWQYSFREAMRIWRTHPPAEAARWPIDL